jgi:hypothetical protein
MSRKAHSTIRKGHARLQVAAQEAEPAFLTRIRLRAQRRALWLRRLWASYPAGAGQGQAISDPEIDQILQDPVQGTTAEESFYRGDEHARQLSEAIRSADERALGDAGLQRLGKEFTLSAPELDLLALTVAVELDPRLRRVCGYLQDDAMACYPTPWLASGLFAWPASASPGRDSALLRWQLARPLAEASQPWGNTVPWAADPYIVAWLLQRGQQDTALGQAATLVRALDVAASHACLYPEQLAAMEAFARAFQGQEAAAPVRIELVGAAGVGKRTLAAQLASALGTDLVVADAGALFGDGVPVALACERAVRAVRLARLEGAAIYWHNAEGVDLGLCTAAEGIGLALFGVPAPLTWPAGEAVARQSWQLPPLTRAARLALWRTLTDQPAPDPLAEWQLTPAEIKAAAQVAPAGMEATARACQQLLHQVPGELFTPLPTPYTWDDMVLMPPLRQHLAELEQQVRLRWHVYEEWGFERLCPLGKGISALFSGPSGTGKTMAAQVLARALGLELYRVDLSGVMNKYIGETEKRLKQIFDACERANVLLFFDEADALFGQRTQVKDAHDRFANIEIDYLLQRMEQFDGLAILATNRKNDLDLAFLRRLRFIIDFLQPAPAERLALWQKALLPIAANGHELLDTLNWAFLADKLAMSGAEIKAAALNAAFLACAEGKRIGMRHILHAARRELSKHGVAVRAGAWEGWNDGPAAD